MLRDSETNERIPLIIPGQTLIGRAKSCQIQPNSTSISKKHALIEVTTHSHTHSLKDIWIEDLGSRNGTFTGTPDNWNIINEKKRRIKIGDYIKFGLSVTYYRLERVDDESAVVESAVVESALVEKKQQGVSASASASASASVSASMQEYEPKSLAVKQHKYTPPAERVSMNDDKIGGNSNGALDLDPPSFQYEENALLYSNIDDDYNVSDVPTRQQRPPNGNRSELQSSYDKNNVSMQPIAKENKIHVSVEYPEGMDRHKPPVSILIGGDEEGSGRRSVQQSGEYDWNDGNYHSNDNNSNTRTEQLRMPPEPVPMDYSESNDFVAHEHRLREPTLASSLDMNMDPSRRAALSREQKSLDSRTHSPAKSGTGHGKSESYSNAVWDTDVSDSYLQHLNDCMTNSGSARKGQSENNGFSNFNSFEKPAPSSLSVSPSPMGLRGEAFDLSANSAMQRPTTRGKTPQQAPHTAPNVSTSLMNPILMEEDERRPQHDQYGQQSQEAWRGGIASASRGGGGLSLSQQYLQVPHRSLNQNQGFHQSVNLDSSRESLLYAQQSQPTPLTTQERQMIEEARDSLASGIRVANKTLGGLMDMQDWREYASRILGQVSEVPGGGDGCINGAQDFGINESKEKERDSEEEKAILEEEEKRDDFLRAVLSPPVLQVMKTESELYDSRYTAKEALQQALRNMRFLIEYDNNFTMEEMEEAERSPNKDFDGVLYNKVIDNTVGLLTKRLPHSGMVRALDESFGVLEAFIATADEEPFKSMQFPPYARDGGLTNYFEKGVLPKLSGLKTFNLGMMSGAEPSGKDGKDGQPGVLSNFQLEQVNKRILNNLQQDMLPVLQMMVDAHYMASGEKDPAQSLSSIRSGDVVASKSSRLRASKNGNLASSLVGLSAEYSPGELRLSVPGPDKSTEPRARQSGQGDAWTSFNAVRNGDKHAQQEEANDERDEYEYISPDDEDIEIQVLEGRAEAAQVYESWVQVKLLLESVVSESGGLTEDAAAELQREVAQWYRHYIASGQLTGKRDNHSTRVTSSSRRGRSRSPRRSDRRGNDRDRSYSPRHKDHHGMLTSDDDEDSALSDNEVDNHKENKLRHSRSGVVVEMKKNGSKSQIYIPRNKHRRERSRSPRTKDEIVTALAQTSESEVERRVELEQKLKVENDRLILEAKKHQEALEEQKEERDRLAAEIERKEKEKLSTEAELEKQNKAHRVKVIKGIERMRKRMFAHFLSKRFRVWQLFTERQRANDTTANMLTNFKAHADQMTAAERKKAEEMIQEKERQREEYLLRERQLSEAAAKEREEQAEKNLQRLLEEHQLKGNEALEQKVLAITQEKERLMEEERRMSTLERNRLLEERDKLIQAEKDKERDLTLQIQTLVDTNGDLSTRNERKLRVLKLLSSMGDRLDRAVKISFSKWVKFSIKSKQHEVAKKEEKKSIKRMLRILLGVHKESLREVIQRAFRQWERASTAEKYLSSISSNEAETIAGLRGKVVELQEEMMALTSKQEGAASWVAERALNRELSWANHDLQQRFSELQWRLLEVAKVPPAERKQLVNAVLLDREQEVAKSRKEVRVLREQVSALEKYLHMPLTDRPVVSPVGSKSDPATNSPDKYTNNSRSGNQFESETYLNDPPSNQSKVYRQKFQIGNKMTKQDALQVVLSEMQHLKVQNLTLKEDNARKGSELAEESGQRYQMSLSLSVLQQRLLNKERRLDILQKELTKQIGSTEVAMILDSPLVK